MIKTFCGKNCDDCPQRQECAGCNTGQKSAEALFGCPVAKCCLKNKGRMSCDPCSEKEYCVTLRRYAQSPAEWVDRNASLFAPLLWTLFWLAVANCTIGFFLNDTIFPLPDWPVLLGTVLDILYQVARGWILLKLSHRERYFSLAGRCGLWAAGLQIFSELLARDNGRETIAFAIIYIAVSLLQMIMQLVSVGHEFRGYASILQDLDESLSQKWLKLRTWYIGFMVALFVFMVCALSVPLFVGMMQATVFSMLIVDIVEYVYLYETAKLFRWYWC